MGAGKDWELAMSHRFRVIVGIVSFGVLAMSVLLGAFVGNASNVPSATKLEIRLAETQPATGLVEAKVSHSDKTIYLHESPVFTDEDVTSTRVLSGDDRTRFNVGVLLSQQGSEKTGNATESHVGKPVAILLNGDVIAAPILRGVVSQKALIIGDWTKAQADEIAAALNGQ
jgi:preprotein translocase subunit SecD